jgi:hypothetical protein
MIEYLLLFSISILLGGDFRGEGGITALPETLYVQSFRVSLPYSGYP